MLAANTAYADFPRLAAIIGRDGYLPRQFSNRGDRLVFSNGILILAGLAGVLLLIFKADVSLLIPLYAVGVFTSFTLSQTGMVIHHLEDAGRRVEVEHRHHGTRRRGDVHRRGRGDHLEVHDRRLDHRRGDPDHRGGPQAGEAPLREGRRLAALHAEVEARRRTHTAVVLVAGVHRGSLMAIDYARRLHPEHLLAVSIAPDEKPRPACGSNGASTG